MRVVVAVCLASIGLHGANGARADELDPDLPGPVTTLQALRHVFAAAGADVNYNQLHLGVDFQANCFNCALAGVEVLNAGARRGFVSAMPGRHINLPWLERQFPGAQPFQWFANAQLGQMLRLMGAQPPGSQFLVVLTTMADGHPHGVPAHVVNGIIVRDTAGELGEPGRSVIAFGDFQSSPSRRLLLTPHDPTGVYWERAVPRVSDETVLLSMLTGGGVRPQQGYLLQQVGRGKRLVIAGRNQRRIPGLFVRPAHRAFRGSTPAPVRAPIFQRRR